MSDKHRLPPLTLLLALLAPGTGEAEEPARSVDQGQVVQRALERNPGLRAALADARSAAQDLRAEESLYIPRLTLEAGGTHARAPGFGFDASGSSLVTVTGNDSLDLASELSHTFAFGTALSLRLQGSRSTSEADRTGTGDLISFGPGYGLLGRLSLHQPLLRGFGGRVGEASLRQARLGRTAAEHTRDRTASELLRDALSAYWELWYLQHALAIERAAFELAVRQRDEAARRVSAGALARTELYSFETRVAELEQSVVAADQRRQEQSLSLALLLADDPLSSGPLAAAEAEVPVLSAKEPAQAAAEALAQSPELGELRAQLELAQERALVAGEAERPRLDVDAYLQAQGLGDQRVGPAFEQLGGLDALSAHVGLVLELPLSGQRYDAQLQSAGLTADAARARVQAAELRVRSSVSTELLRLKQIARRVELAATSARIAQQSVDARQERYQRGDGILLEVYEAQDTLRRALLAVERSKVDGVQAGLRLQHLTGELLTRHAR